MARTVKAHAVRRNEILDAAQRLIYTKGYEQMTIQDILDSLQIAKGTFYHYFDSKQALLEVLIERILAEMEQVLTPIVHDPHLPALEKFQHVFATLARWKTAQKTFLLALLRVWYMDENVIVLRKMRTAAFERVAPLLTVIIHHGRQEGVLTTPYPDQAGGVIFALLQSFEETLV
ncbi:MAG: TetR/AcrR family transcriptional regulator, partial [Ktedonobacteraceae bacterium]|nr:TetR/AcrR family transcriptional regulator [Ktedonobacteraceae bacterium]